MRENGLVAEHKVEVPAHTLILAQRYPTSRKGTLLQACEKEYWNLIDSLHHYFCGIMYNL